MGKPSDGEQLPLLDPKDLPPKMSPEEKRRHLDQVRKIKELLDDKKE